MPQAVNSATYQIVHVLSRVLQLGDASSLGVVIGMMVPSFLTLSHLLSLFPATYWNLWL